MSGEVQPFKAGVAIPISAEIAEDARLFSAAMDEMCDRWLRPWKFPDPNPMPHFRWWPWIDEIRSAWNERSERVGEALRVLRHGVEDRGDW